MKKLYPYILMAALPLILISWGMIGHQTVATEMTGQRSFHNNCVKDNFINGLNCNQSFSDRISEKRNIGNNL